MLRITASQFQNTFGATSDKALQRPITITKKGRDHLVVMSAEEYVRLKRARYRTGAAGQDGNSRKSLQIR